MKKIILLLCLMLNFEIMFAQGVAINLNNNQPDSTAMLDIQSINKGFLLPRMTETQRNSINNPAFALQIFNITSACLQIYYANTWNDIWCTDSCVPPTTMGLISGDTSFCPNITGNNFTVNSVDNATNYVWSVPIGWSITNGQGTTTITFTSSNYGEDGEISVYAENSCGKSDTASISANIKSLSTAPTSINGPILLCDTSAKLLAIEGGSLGTGATWKWYEGGCGSGVSIGDSSTTLVEPSVTTTYYVRAEGDCNNTTCTNLEIEIPTILGGQVAYTTPGTYSWTVPVGVTSVSVVCVGGGGSGAKSASHSDGKQAGGGGGGALAWKNNIAVTPGNSIPITIGSRGPCPGAGESDGFNGEASLFGDTIFYAEGGKKGTVGILGYGGDGGCPSLSSDGGGCGGRGGHATGTDQRFSGGGGGAGGYTGNGGRGGESPDSWFGEGEEGQGGGAGGAHGGAYRGGGGGGVGLIGQGFNGYGGYGGINDSNSGGGGGSCSDNGNQSGMHYAGYGGNYGGGAGAQNYTSGSTWVGTGGHGACRVIWPGDIRQFPSTRTENE